MSQEENNHQQCQETGSSVLETPPTSVSKPYFFIFQQHKSLPAVSVVIILTSVVFKYLTESKPTLGLSSSPPASSWASPILLWSLFLIYSCGLVWLSAQISVRFGRKAGCEVTLTHSPTTLARLRSHLTFLPIIHFIRQRPPAAETSEGDTLNDEFLRDNDASTVPRDKEYLSKLEFQRDALIDAILDGYVFPWYERISDEKTFPVQSRRILQTSFDHLAKKFRQMDRTAVAREAIEVLHYHWKTYLDAAKKASSTDNKGGCLEQHFKYLHSFVDSREQLSKHYESLTSVLLKELLIPDLQSHLICRFLAGILVKGFVLYYVDLISNPKWINFNIMNLLSSGTINSTQTPELPISNGSSRDSLCDLSSTCKCGCMESSHRESDSSFHTDTTQPTSSRPSADISSSDKELCDNKALLEQFTDGMALDGGDLGSNDANGSNKNGIDDARAKKAASVSAALGGLLSTTALPLLPEGYNLQPSPATEQDEHLLTEEHEVVRIEMVTATNGSPEPIATSKTDTEDTPEESTADMTDSNKYNAPVYSMNRHFSFDDGPKAKPVLGEDKATKSLDETKANCTVLRQEEFDMSGDNMLKPGDGFPTKSDISPTYDEAEDFAATIAKLRSLLEQRESQKNLHENLNNENGDSEVFSLVATTSETVPKSTEESQTAASASPPQPIRRVAESVRPSLNSQSSASSLGSDGSLGSTNSQSSLDADRLEKITDELEESGPQVNRFFINVAIPKTETCSDSSGQFVLYSIQYEGVYLEENDDGQLEKLVLRTTTIKRRFQEFLTLHNHLEENPLWRPHIKGIKAPSKWLNLSFAKSESANTAQKKGMLEHYLQQLCYHPVLGFCPYLRQFMAYGEDGFYAFVAPEAIPLHRFDKIAKKFTGVFNTVREALPSFETELLAVPNSPDLATKSPTDNRGKSLFASFLRAEKHSPIEKADDGKQDSIDVSKAGDGVGNGDSCSDSNGNGKADNDDNNVAEAKERLNMEQCFSESTTLLEEPLVEGSMDAVYPLAVAATQLLCDVLWLPHHRPHAASVSAFLSISGKSFENYIQDLLDVFLSQEAVLGCLEAATAAVKEWAKLEDCATMEPELPSTTEAELKNCLRQKIPVWVRWMWGRSRVDVTIDRLTKVCQDSQINHDLILSLVELLFSKIVDANLENDGDKV